MIETREVLEKKLKLIKKVKVEKGFENEIPGAFQHDMLLSRSLLLNKVYHYIVNLDNFVFRIVIYEKDNILFHDGRFTHTKKDFECPLCERKVIRGSTCKVLSKHLDDFLHFLCTKHSSTRAKFITGSIFQGKKVFPLPDAFGKMSSLEYSDKDNCYYRRNIKQGE